MTDKHLLVMRTHSMDKNTAVLVNDFIRATNFHMRLGRVFLDCLKDQMIVETLLL